MNHIFLISLFLAQIGPLAHAQLDQNYHSCGGGNGSSVPASIVSTLVTGDPSTPEQYNNAVNKRMGCCLHVRNTQKTTFTGSVPGNNISNGDEKFDCVDNAQTQYASFDDLWASSTDGLPNAVVLRNTFGNIITGWYMLNGQKCNEFGEFTDQPIQKGKVDPVIKSGIQMNKNSDTTGNIFSSSGYGTIPVPTVSSWQTDYISHVSSGFLHGPPDCQAHPNDCFRCPLLVRAAMVAKCPINNNPSNKFTYQDSTTHLSQCAAASSIVVHVKVEQVYEISGQKTITPINTITNSGMAGSIDVRALINH